ncbi:MAG: hypothetical protein QM730_18175 [Anaerolineales bacterium]
MTLYEPGTDHPIAILSYWHVTDSPHGIGNALILWLNKAMLSKTIQFSGGILCDHLPLAHMLTETLTQYFPEFSDVPVASLPYHEAHCEHTYENGERYVVRCVSGKDTISVEWIDPLDRRAISIPDFPIGDQCFELRNVVCPCGSGLLRINDQIVPGTIQTGTRADGFPSSTAFLAFAESWVGPVHTHSNFTGDNS